MEIKRTMTDLTWDDLCDLMCGCPEDYIDSCDDVDDEVEDACSQD